MSAEAATENGISHIEKGNRTVAPWIIAPG